MLYYLAGVILVVFINSNLSLDEPMIVKEVVMHGPATFFYSVRLYDIICLPNCDFICPDPPCDIKMYALPCEIQPLSDNERLLNLFTDIDRRIKNIEHQPCGTYDNFEIFSLLGNASELACGSLFQADAPGAPYSFINKPYDIGFSSKMLLGNLFILGILALLKKDCVVSTLLWNHDIFSFKLVTSSYIPRNFVVFQTYWNFPIDHLVSRTEPDYIYIINFKSDNRWNKSFYAHMSVTVFVKCNSNYHMQLCWYYCQNVPGKYTCQQKTGLQMCLNEWYTSLVMYVNTYKTLLNFSSVIVPECNMINKCYRHNCSDICVATGNNTSTCIGDRLQFEPKEMYLYAGNVVKCSMAFQEEPTNDTYVSWSYIIDFNGSNNAFSNMMMDGNMLFVLLKAFPSHNNLVRCAVVDSTGKVKLEEFRNYSIIFSPTIIRLNITLQHIFLGDYVKCSSNAWPESDYIYTFSIISNAVYNNGEPDSGVIRIPINAKLGKAFLNCTIQYKSNNESLPFTKIFQVYIYAMRLFKWKNTRTPIFFINDTVELELKINVLHHLEIIQLVGPSELLIANKKIKFNTECKGGRYEIVALLYIGNHKSFLTFYRFFQGNLLKIPTHASLSRYKPNPNEIIYCMTDGYPKSYVVYDFQISDHQGNVITKAHGDFITIPANSTIGTRYTIECNYTMTIKNITYTGYIEDSVLLLPRMKAFQLMYITYVGPITFAFCSFIYLYQQFILVFIFITVICYFFHGSELSHLLETFVNYNNHRRGIRIHEKMNHISNIILVMKTSAPNEKLKLAAFYNYLKINRRGSLTPGFAHLPKGLHPKLEKNEISQETPDEGQLPLPHFYGVGPMSKYNINIV